MFQTRRGSASVSLSRVMLAAAAMIEALAARLRLVLGQGRGGRGAGGRGLAGSRVPRRPRLPFLPARGAEAMPDEVAPRA